MENRTRNTARIAIIPTALREARLRKFWTPEQLAKKASVGVGTIKAAEGSERFVHLSTAQRLADALGCTPNEIAQVKTEEGAA
jgi:transcriptional regulator with XRE-family HTH domain